MKLILGISKDGFLARCKDDDMSWLGTTDKMVFRLLTNIGGILYASKKTCALLPSSFSGRVCYPLSTKEYTLEKAFKTTPNAWLIGGPTLALEALKGGYVHEAILCLSDRCAFPSPCIQGAIKNEITPFLESSPYWNKRTTVKVIDVNVEYWTNCQL